MRFDTVMLVLIIILVAFGFGSAELIKTYQALDKAQAEILELTAKVNTLQTGNLALTEQILSLQKERDALAEQILSLQNEKQDLLNKIEALNAEIQAVRQQLDTLLREQDVLKTKLVEQQNNLDQADLLCSANNTLSKSNGFAKQPSGQALGELLGWIISGFVTLGAILTAILLHNNAKIFAETKIKASRNYVQLTPDECNLIIRYRRNR